MTFNQAWVSLMGAGYAPLAPGTIGSLVAILLWPVFTLMPLFYMFLLWIILFLVSWYLTHKVLCSQSQSDPSWIVIDEALAVWLIPMAFNGQWSIHWLWVWCIFRIIDSLKPWPVSAVEHMKPDVFAVIFDDIVAVVIAIFMVKFWYIAI